MAERLNDTNIITAANMSLKKPGHKRMKLKSIEIENGLIQTIIKTIVQQT